MDNRIFNVNGDGIELLRETLKLIFLQRGFGAPETCIAWKVDDQKGLILQWAIHSGDTKAQKFPAPLSAEQVTQMVFNWLKSEEAKKIPMVNWDANRDHDGHNEIGWRVYVEEWGHVGEERYAICAIKPAWMWFGK